ncbi:MAG: MATE family efflux transporter [Synergistaceae bacterium]|nr:MATE family efflux transporter [Synergistaceae bacterium]
MARNLENSREIFEAYSIPRALATLAVPTIIGQLIVLIYSLADTFYIGRTNNPLMVAGVSLILPVFNISISLANLVGVGGGTLISRLLGAGRDAEARKVSAFSFYFAILSSTLFAVGMGAFLTPILRLLGASDATLPYARQYSFCVVVLGALPTVLSLALSNLLRSVGCSKQAGFGVSVGGLVNVGLDPLFMFVLLPPGMEAVGAGVATLLSNILVCVYYLFTLYRMRGQTALSISPLAGFPGRQEVRGLFSVGVPAAIGTLLFDLAYIIIDKLATGYGDIPLAAIGIVLKAERLPLNVGIGIGQGMIPIAAYNYSAGNFDRMRKVVNFSRLVGLAVGAVSVALYECFAPDIVRVFIEDAETVRIGTNFLRVRCVATPFMFLCFHLLYLFQAVGFGGWALFLAVVRWAVFNIPLLFLLNALMGMYGIVWTQVTADICTVAVSFLVYWHFERTVLLNR